MQWLLILTFPEAALKKHIHSAHDSVEAEHFQKIFYKAGDNGFTTTGKLMQWLWILTKSEASLKKHIYAAHVTEKIFKCNDCEF